MDGDFKPRRARTITLLAGCPCFGQRGKIRMSPAFSCNMASSSDTLSDGMIIVNTPLCFNRLNIAFTQPDKVSDDSWFDVALLENGDLVPLPAE